MGKFIQINFLHLYIILVCGVGVVLGIVKEYYVTSFFLSLAIVATIGQIIQAAKAREEQCRKS